MTVLLWVMFNAVAVLAVLALIVEGMKPPAEEGYAGDGDTVVDLVIQPEELRR